MKVGWRFLAPIFADIVVSPWNLLVGGILIQHLSFFQAALAIIGGYSVLFLIFILYGGLGFKEKKQSSELLSEVFGSKVVRYIIPVVLAVGQIGWAAINIDLGGRSVSALFALPDVWGLVSYTIILIMIALLNLQKMGIVKLFVSLSALGLVGFLFITKLQTNNISSVASYQPLIHNSFFWGMSVVVASMISFSTVTPDFFQYAQSKKDIVLSTIIGLFPGIIVTLVGCFLFYDRSSLDLIGLLSVSSFALFPNLFNAITNSDGSTAMYTPALKLKSILPINFSTGVVFAASCSLLLALTHISLHISEWLTILSLIFPAFIGVCFTALLFKKLLNRKIYHKEVMVSFAMSILIAVFATSFFPPVILALLAPILIFTFSIGYSNLSVL